MDPGPQRQALPHLGKGTILVMPVDYLFRGPFSQTLWVGNLCRVTPVVQIRPFKAGFMFKEPRFTPVNLIMGR